MRCGVCRVRFRCGLLLFSSSAECAIAEQAARLVPLRLFDLCWIVGLRGWIFVVAILGLVFNGMVAVMPEPRGLQVGALLIASRQIRSGIFHHSVVLVVEHSPFGAKGLILNELYANIGGPVMTDSYVAYLYDGRESSNATSVCSGGGHARSIVPGVCLQESEEDTCKETFAACSRIPSSFRLRGYAGWAPRQLESEIFLGAWMLANATGRLVFDVGRERIWHHFASTMKTT